MDEEFPVLKASDGTEVQFNVHITPEERAELDFCLILGRFPGLALPQ